MRWLLLENKHPLILGIESSCDETSAALLCGFDVLSHVVYSQLIHQHYGGVVPELASREHETAISRVVDKTFAEAGNISPHNVDAIAVTYGPGLMGALLVGLNFAKGMVVALKKPLIAINHIEAHLYAPFLDFPNLQPPMLCLLVSGGHTLLIDVKGIRDFTILGETLDDAAGESFDKVARLLNIGYPGGPLIDKLSEKGDPNAIRFPRPYLEKESLNFSFSGLKTAVLNYTKTKESFTDQEIADIAAGFQAAVVDVLEEKVRRAVLQTGHKQVILAGGVAANRLLRKRLKNLEKTLDIHLYYPSLKYCTDNAAMIAAAGVLYYEKGWTSGLDVPAVPNLRIYDHSYTG